MTDAVPPWAYERAQILPYDPCWADRARTEVAQLTGLLAPWLAGQGDGGVEHVGSTSVPGLAAKPIIDVMAAVTDLDLVAEQALAPLTAGGWCFVPPELDEHPWRRFFVKPDASGQRREAHLHLIRAGNPRWAEQLEFREALRQDPQLARRYEELKRALAREHGHDREAYTAGKGAFVDRVLGRRATR
jgi:GrpB-like predicted nucleotidyltransferase (UPF0157 family)